MFEERIDELKKRFELLTKPYIQIRELAIVTETSTQTVSKKLKESKIKKFDRFGYRTNEAIELFGLEEYFEMLCEMARNNRISKDA